MYKLNIIAPILSILRKPFCCWNNVNRMTFLLNILFGIKVYKEKILAFKHFSGFNKSANFSSQRFL